MSLREQQAPCREAADRYSDMTSGEMCDAFLEGWGSLREGLTF